MSASTILHGYLYLHSCTHVMRGKKAAAASWKCKTIYTVYSSFALVTQGDYTVAKIMQLITKLGDNFFTLGMSLQKDQGCRLAAGQRKARREKPSNRRRENQSNGRRKEREKYQWKETTTVCIEEVGWEGG